MLREMLKCLKIPLLKKKRSRGFRRQRGKEGKEEMELHGSRILTTLPALSSQLQTRSTPHTCICPSLKGASFPGCRPHETVLMCDSRRKKKKNWSGNCSISCEVLTVAPWATEKSFFLVRHLIIPHDPLGETSKGPPNGICRARSPHPAKASFTVPCPSCETLVPSQFNVFSWVAETLPLTGRGSISGRFMLISQQWKSGGLLYSHSVGDK